MQQKVVNDTLILLANFRCKLILSACCVKCIPPSWHTLSTTLGSSYKNKFLFILLFSFLKVWCLTLPMPEFVCHFYWNQDSVFHRFSIFIFVFFLPPLIKTSFTLFIFLLFTPKWPSCTAVHIKKDSAYWDWDTASS